jgi:hypothetical protein
MIEAMKTKRFLLCLAVCLLWGASAMAQQTITFTWSGYDSYVVGDYANGYYRSFVIAEITSNDDYTYPPAIPSVEEDNGNGI